MVERNERRVRRVRRWDGVSALARELGLSRCFVSQVLNGKRRSARVEAAARAKGWKGAGADGAGKERAAEAALDRRARAEGHSISQEARAALDRHLAR